jgi:hypothetical protein
MVMALQRREESNEMSAYLNFLARYSVNHIINNDLNTNVKAVCFVDNDTVFSLSQFHCLLVISFQKNTPNTVTSIKFKTFPYTHKPGLI